MVNASVDVLEADRFFLKEHQVCCSFDTLISIYKHQVFFEGDFCVSECGASSALQRESIASAPKISIFFARVRSLHSAICCLALLFSSKSTASCLAVL